MYPAVLAGLIGLGGLEVAYADSEEVYVHHFVGDFVNCQCIRGHTCIIELILLLIYVLQAASKQGLPADAPANNMEDIAKKQRQQIDDLLKSKGIRRGSYPNFTVSVKGQKVIESLLGCNLHSNVLRLAHAHMHWLAMSSSLLNTTW